MICQKCRVRMNVVGAPYREFQRCPECGARALLSRRELEEIWASYDDDNGGPAFQAPGRDVDELYRKEHGKGLCG